MKIKRFLAADMRAAIRQVREEQGPDAVILSNRRVGDGVEVVAATDYDEALVQQALRAPAATSAPAASTPAPAPAAPQAAAPPSQIIWATDPQLTHMQQELTAVRGLLESQVARLAWHDLANRSPEHVRALQHLEAIGVESELARSLVDSIPRDAKPGLVQRLPIGYLAKALPAAEEDPIDRGGVFALVGPTGVGKTTTVAKLAARYGARHGLRNVALVSTDHYRVGAREQLFTYGRLLGVPVHTAASRDELAATLQKLKDYSLVLIDTAGMSPADRMLASQFGMLGESPTPIKTYLVLAANCHGVDLDEVVQRFHGARPAGCILTKLDETRRLGAALSIAVRRQLPIAYVTDGQRVPEDLQLGRGTALVLRAVEQALRHAQITEPAHAAA